MTLVKWAPKPISLLDDFDGIFNPVFDRDWNISSNLTSGSGPAVDIKEKDDSFLLFADIPGLNKNDINVHIENNVIFISGERKIASNEDYKSYHYRERTYGSFKRSFKLPKNVNEKKISAEFNNGVLSIIIPKLKGTLSKERKIKVN